MKQRLRNRITNITQKLTVVQTMEALREKRIFEINNIKEKGAKGNAPVRESVSSPGREITIYILEKYSPQKRT